MFKWVENEIITINPGKETKKVRDGKYDSCNITHIGAYDSFWCNQLKLFSFKSDKTSINAKCMSPISQSQNSFYKC